MSPPFERFSYRKTCPGTSGHLYGYFRLSWLVVLRGTNFTKIREIQTNVPKMAVQSTYMYIDLIVIIIKSMGINVLCYNKYSGMCKAM